MNFKVNRINPNQTQVFFDDGRFETLTDEELEELMHYMGLGEVNEGTDMNLID